MQSDDTVSRRAKRAFLKPFFPLTRVITHLNNLSEFLSMCQCTRVHLFFPPLLTRWHRELPIATSGATDLFGDAKDGLHSGLLSPDLLGKGLVSLDFFCQQWREE